MKIKNGRAYELSAFLTVTPKEIGDYQKFATIRKFRESLNKSLGEYKTKLDEFQTWKKEQMQPYADGLKDFVRPEKCTDAKWEKMRMDKEKEINDAFAAQIKDRLEEVMEYEKTNMDEMIETPDAPIEVQEYFKSKGHEFPFWASFAAGYSEVAESLGL